MVLRADAEDIHVDRCGLQKYEKVVVEAEKEHVEKEPGAWTLLCFMGDKQEIRFVC